MSWSHLHLPRFPSNPRYFHGLHGSDYITGSLPSNVGLAGSQSGNASCSLRSGHIMQLCLSSVSVLRRLPNGAAAAAIFFLKKVKNVNC